MMEERTTPLRERMIEDMHIRGLGDKARQAHIRAIKDFAGFLKRSPDTATPDDLRAYQLHMTNVGVTPTTKVSPFRLQTIQNSGRPEFELATEAIHCLYRLQADDFKGASQRERVARLRVVLSASSNRDPMRKRSLQACFMRLIADCQTQIVTRDEQRSVHIKGIAMCRATAESATRPEAIPANNFIHQLLTCWSKKFWPKRSSR
jgi:hypothetical protein